MALKVPDIGEIESIRFLINSTQTAPRNLILKLLTNGTATPWSGEAETDTPKSLRTATFVEPYTYAVGGGGSAASPKAYPLASVAQYTGGAITTLPYSNQYGILLHGTNWRVQTTGTTQATYPEQTFTFTPDAAFYVHGYYVARANSFAQTFLNNLTGGATITANSSTYTLTASTANAYSNVLGSAQLRIDATTSKTGAAVTGGSVNSTIIAFSGAGSTTGIQVGQYVVGTGVGPYARVTGIVTDTYISVSVPNVAAVASTTTLSFYEGRIAPGQSVSGTGVAGSTVVQGWDPNTGIVFVNNVFTANVTGTITFGYSLISATAHGGLIGDTFFLAANSATLTEGVYTVIDGGTGSVSGANAFATWPNIPCSGAGSVVIYDNIMYEEKFTNGPYYIQNSGDQIKITLNVSLD
jgi:hypothetical protein